METELTKRLLGHLIKKGYKYYLIKTSSIDQNGATVGILLKFVKKHPKRNKLPKPFENYYDNMLEPLRMATGILGTIVTVDLNAADFKSYKDTFPLPLNS